MPLALPLPARFAVVLRLTLGAAGSCLLFAAASHLGPLGPWCTLLGLVPWLVALEGVGLRAALGAGLLLSAAFVAGPLSWLPATLASYASLSLPAAWALSLVAAPVFVEPQIVPAVLLRTWTARRSRAAAAVVFALAWAGLGWALPKLFADELAFGLFPSPWLRQGAELVGARGLSLACVVVAECLAARRRGPALAALGVVLALLAYGAVRLPQVEARTAAAPRYAVGVVQANIGSYDKLAAERGVFETVQHVVDTHLRLSQALLSQGPLDLLVWPETVYPTTFGAPKSEEGAEFDRAIAALPAQTGVPLVLGAFEASDQGEHNAAFVLSREGEGVAFETYQKSLLFPLTERVPTWLDRPAVRAALPWLGHWQPGPGPRVLRAGPVRVAPLLCYEAVHEGYVAEGARAGAELLLTLSNDAWFPDARAPRLHLVAAALRSIETRLPQVRATNSGVSALVLPSGELVHATRFGEQATLRLEVPRPPPSWTPAKAWGDWVGPAALLGCLLAIGTTFRRRMS